MDNSSFSDLRERQHYEFWVVARTPIGTNQIYHSIRENYLKKRIFVKTFKGYGRNKSYTINDRNSFTFIILVKGNWIPKNFTDFKKPVLLNNLTKKQKQKQKIDVTINLKDCYCNFK